MFPALIVRMNGDRPLLGLHLTPMSVVWFWEKARMSASRG